MFKEILLHRDGRVYERFMVIRIFHCLMTVILDFIRRPDLPKSLSFGNCFYFGPQMNRRRKET
jgi:hypothetical protein